jgi:hypothetical protein
VVHCSMLFEANVGERRVVRPGGVRPARVLATLIAAEAK